MLDMITLLQINLYQAIALISIYTIFTYNSPTCCIVPYNI